jgi:mitochondrial import receptor subunit TOM40
LTKSSLNSPTPRTQVEADYTGSDYNVNTKIIDGNPLNGTGILVSSYSQSLTKKLSAGVEFVYQRPTPHIEDSGFSYGMRYTGEKWVAAANLIQLSAFNVSYFQKISERVELGSEFSLSLRSPQQESVTTVGTKLEFKTSVIRAQLDTKGKLGVMYEQRLAPGFSVLVSGEIDHVKTNGKFGVGIQVEQ